MLVQLSCKCPYSHLLCLLLIPHLDYVPVYLQACKGLSPLHSGIDLLAVSLLVASFAIVGGISTAKTGYYRPQAWLGWVLAVVGAGLLVMIRADSDLALLIVFIAITSAGIGLVNPSANFTILAPGEYYLIVCCDITI
jgi:hypothetical protein